MKQREEREGAMDRPMTRERLEQFRKAKEKVDILNKLAAGMVADKVKGSMTQHPYIEKEITIIGVDERLARRATRENSRLEAEKEDILRFIEGIEDPLVAKLILYRYVQNKTWVRIWKLSGCEGSVDGYRRMVSRYLDGQRG